MIFQAFNKRTNRWVKIRKFADGKTRILAVKLREPTTPFKGIKKRN